MTTTRRARFQVIGGTVAEWAANDIVPLVRELALETDTGRFKFGNGVTAYSGLPYASGVDWGDITGTLSAQTDLQAALSAKEPTITAGTTAQYWRGDKSWQTLNAAAVGITASALTRTNDTNVTLTLGGSPSTALLAGVSLTLGWAGLLPASRGGTGVNSSTGTGSVVLSTNPGFTTQIVLNSAGSADLYFTANSAAVAGRMRLDSAGNLAFRNETSGGVFFDAANAVITFRDFLNSSATVFRISTADVRPGVDNSTNLGTASFRWKEVFAGNATINTSDERLKDWLGGLSPDMLRAGLRIADEIGLYRWVGGSRIHVGVRAQQVARILMDEGVEDPQPLDFAADVFIPEGERPSFRMSFLTFDTWEAVREPVMREKCIKRATATDAAITDSVQRVATATYRPKKGEVIDADGLVWRERPAGNVFGIRTEELSLFLNACEAAERRRLTAMIEALSAR
ncbi:hypothetical protein [Sphingomonas sp.]|uniref:hyaluronate lyase N-terminal domain-containing protein n=1 Tax=Sphingomonas sp. TaxID=28214 RepID=UPI003BAA632F